MKTSLIFLLLIMLTSSIYGEVVLEIGYLELKTYAFRDPYMIDELGLYSIMSFSKQFKFVVTQSIETNIETWMTCYSPIGYSPFRVIYDLEYKVHIKNFAIGISHSCSHPVLSQYDVQYWRHSYGIGERSSIFLRYTIK